jgi:Protein of unknown function (DUF3631)
MIPKAPGGEYSRGKPLTQRQLAKMLGQFGVISDTVHPPGLPQGKGYKRVDLLPQWETYCPPKPGQNPLSERPPYSRAYKRTNADETGTTRDFSSVQDPSPYGSKNGNLPHSHAGLYVCTDRNGGEATEGHSDHENAVGDGAHYPPVCSHCGSSEPAPNLVAFDGLNIWLHRGCEVAWVNGVN